MSFSLFDFFLVNFRWMNLHFVIIIIIVDFIWKNKTKIESTHESPCIFKELFFEITILKYDMLFSKDHNKNSRTELTLLYNWKKPKTIIFMSQLLKIDISADTWSNISASFKPFKYERGLDDKFNFNASIDNAKSYISAGWTKPFLLSPKKWTNTFFSIFNTFEGHGVEYFCFAKTIESTV